MKTLIVQGEFLYVLEVGVPLSVTGTSSNSQTIFRKFLSLVWNYNVLYSGGIKSLETNSEFWKEV